MFAVTTEEDVSIFDNDVVIGWDVYSELGDGGELIGYVAANGYGVGDDKSYDNLSDAVFAIANAISNRVRAGAILLDEHRPDWWKRINTDALSMNKFDLCIIGQTFNITTPEPGDFDTPSYSTQYNMALDSMGIPWREGDGFGFDVEAAEYMTYETLKHCWIEQIEWRREKDSD